jgi:hypothetical protein
MKWLCDLPERCRPLPKIKSWSHKILMHAGWPATEQMFIRNLCGVQGLVALFGTHLPSEQRFARVMDPASTWSTVAV